MRKSMTPLLAAVLFSLNRLLSAGDVLPEYPCHHLASPPAMDGGDWGHIPEAGAFFILGGKDYAIEKQTFFRSGWTDDSLYIQIKCVEPLPGKMKASRSEGDSLWADDGVEVFLQPASASKYYQFITNSVGARWNAVGPENREAKPWNWEARPGKWEKGWLMSVRIPFSILGKTPEPGDAWPTNIARGMTTGPAAERNTCWPPLRKGFNDLERFGRFVFRSEAPRIKETETRLSESFHQYLKEQCAANVRDAGKAELMAAFDNPALAAEAKPIKELLGNLSQPHASPEERALKLTAWRNLMACLTEKARRLDIPLEKAPKLEIPIGIEARQAKDVKLWVNGKAAPEQSGRWMATLREGVNVLAFSAARDGVNPGIRLDIPEHPELAIRWRSGAPADDQWLAPTFDDRKWKISESGKDGFLLLPSGETYFRQIVIWGESHYSGLLCFQPKVREWGFSENSTEAFFHVLNSPLPFPLEDYELVLDVPKGFKLIEETDVAGQKEGKLNRRPSKIIKEEVAHDGQPHTRYRFNFAPQSVQPDAREGALIPLTLGEFDGPDKSCRFFFRRTASGNVTELERALPVRILPPINGRMPKKVLFCQYSAEPWCVYRGGRLYPRHFDAFMRQAMGAGFNCWIIGSWSEFGRKTHDRVIEGGGIVALGFGNYPLHGDRLGAEGALGQLLRSKPESQAKFFNGTSDWAKRGQYCPSFATGAGAAEFKEAVKKDISLMMHGGKGTKFFGAPNAAIYWTDWEEDPWMSVKGSSEPARSGDGSYCFCKRCKEDFRNCAKLPPEADLSDDAIFKNHKLEWKAFRNELDGRVNGLTREACNELGMQYMLYSGAHQRQFFEACKDKVDKVFIGMPGEGRAVGDRQKRFDDTMTFFREKVGMRSVVGQLFASSIASGILDGKPQPASWMKDGFIDAKSLKPQILRLVASFHGGVDLNSAVERCAGQLYYIGEAARIISEHEELFTEGERADYLAESAQIKYPALLVLKKDKERLVLLFNEGDSPLRISLKNKDLEPGLEAEIVGVGRAPGSPEIIELTVAPNDVAVVHIKPSGGFLGLF